MQDCQTKSMRKILWVQSIGQCLLMQIRWNIVGFRSLYLLFSEMLHEEIVEIVLASLTMKNVGTQIGDIEIFLCPCQNVNETFLPL